MVLEKFQKIREIHLSPLDLLPQQDLREKLVSLVIRGVPEGVSPTASTHLRELRRELQSNEVEEVKVVVFGGGTGLSNIIGGDSRLDSWVHKPFNGLKEIFPKTRSVVCVTDSGGSTGELLKDLPLVAVGDMRHVLLSSIQLNRLQKKYSLDVSGAGKVAVILSAIFNYRFIGPLTRDHEEFITVTSAVEELPVLLQNYLRNLIDYLFTDVRLAKSLSRSHCLGNLLLVAAIYREIDSDITNEDLAGNQKLFHLPVKKGVNSLAETLGAGERAVLPCTSTPGQLRVQYTNGVTITGEHKLSDAQRGVPVESVEVENCGPFQVYEETLEDIRNADILILAPGSLYSSIIPVFKTPGLADAVRENKHAMKILVSNLWVQSGETDISLADPERKFQVSDMIRAYEKNIPGGTEGLFEEVICISLQDIPASVLQRYAVEGKIPIYLDRESLVQHRYVPIECGVYSHNALSERGVIQHDPEILALAIKGLYNGRGCFNDRSPSINFYDSRGQGEIESQLVSSFIPSQRYRAIQDRLAQFDIRYVGDVKHIKENWLRTTLSDILWDHSIIPLEHLDYCTGIQCISYDNWGRDQKWDNVFSFFDPEDKYIKIRGDQVAARKNLEIALAIALGESLLGNYAQQKIMEDVVVDEMLLGRVYHLYLREQAQTTCYLSQEELQTFLTLARMSSTDEARHYTRLVNHGESFTPPGLLMGLMYAWYVDNRLATHIEYKMSVMKIKQSDLIPEQKKMATRRRQMISFFREVIFRKPTKERQLI
ncbi:MAG: gluconeogenesis factor YvcK family protein [Desulforhopalus sp.]